MECSAVAANSAIVPGICTTVDENVRKMQAALDTIAPAA
jgi:hypothetical protein